MEMQFGALQIAVGLSAGASSNHPNELKITGVLTRLDEASTKAPNGSDGHRIYLSTAVAKKRLHTLVGMGLNYSPKLESHNQSKKVGVIKRAWIDGKDLCIEGVIWKHDFPESERDLKGRKDLGMSMEIVSVSIEDQNASVWKIDDFYFSGGTILKKDAAAYYNTVAIAAAKQKGRGEVMADTVKKTVSAKEVASAAVQAALKEVMPLITAQGETLKELQNSVATLSSGIAASQLDSELAALVAGVTAAKDDDDDAEACDMESMGDDEAVDEVDAGNEHGIDTGDLEDMGAGDDSDDGGMPGGANKDTKNRNPGGAAGDISKAGKPDNKAITGSNAVFMKHIKTLVKTVKAQSDEIAKLKKSNQRTNKQITAASASMGRRSVVTSSELNNLLAKGGLTADGIQASSTKLSVQDMDALLAAVPGIPVTSKIQLKSEAAKAGLMDEGLVNR